MSENPKEELLNSTAMSNSLSQFTGNILGGGFGFNPYGGSQLSQADTLWKNERWYLISNFRQLLSEMYVEHGIIQTLVDQPVDDGFRGGVIIKSGELDGEDINALQDQLDNEGILEDIKLAIKWKRLFGGGAIIIATDQEPSLPLNIKAINKNTPLRFIPVDLWELYYTYTKTHDDIELDGDEVDSMDSSVDGDYYDYYGVRIHKSRVIRMDGKKPPSFIRPRLRGWGMSEVEKVVRPLNQYLKNQNVIFELLDEAKQDAFKIKGFNSALLSSNGTNAITQRVQMANMVKNYLSAIVMDAEDDWDQKTMSFTGLGEMLTQVRIDIASAVKMPVTKLFGLSAAGFNSGEDDIENYNSMVESEIRSKDKGAVKKVAEILCQKMFEIFPDDLSIDFYPLRILSAIEEEQVKNHQYNRLTSSLQSGAIDRKVWAEGINKESLLPIEIDENAELLEPIDGDFLTGEGKGVDS